MQRNNCWTARLIRKCHSSSVTAVAWHPSGGLLAATSTDGRCMLFNAGLQGTQLQSRALQLANAVKYVIKTCVGKVAHRVLLQLGQDNVR